MYKNVLSKIFGVAAMAIVIGLTGNSTASASGMDDAVKYNNGHYYKVFNDSMKWTEAKSYCEKMGGHLVTVTDEEEQRFVKKLVEENGKKYYFWLGATDSQKEGTWKWVTGEEWEYENWGEGQPNNAKGHDAVHGQDYLLMCKVPDTEWAYCEWDDQPNDGCSGDSKYYNAPYYTRTNYYGFVCEWELVDIEDASVKLSNTTYTYNGKSRKPQVTVKLDGKKLVKGKDYTVTYIANKYPGYGHAEIEGIGSYEGTIEKYFKINPKKVSGLKIKRINSKKMKVQWKKMKYITGYQLQYKKSGSSWKTIKLAGNAQTKTLKKVANASYKIRVRAYATTHGKTAYGQWATVNIF